MDSDVQQRWESIVSRIFQNRYAKWKTLVTMVLERERKWQYFVAKLYPTLMLYSHTKGPKGVHDEWEELCDKDIPPWFMSTDDYNAETMLAKLDSKYTLIWDHTKYGSDIKLGCCICGKKNIKEHCLIRNKITNFVTWIGSDCINFFRNATLNNTTLRNNQKVKAYISYIEGAIKTHRKFRNKYAKHPKNIEKEDVRDNCVNEMFKICRAPNAKQIEILLKHNSITKDEALFLESMHQSYNTGFDKKKCSITYNRYADLQDVIEINKRVFARYTDFIENIEVEVLLSQQNNDELKKSYIKTLVPKEDNIGKYKYDIHNLKPILVGEKRMCIDCNTLFLIYIPLQKDCFQCKSCFTKQHILNMLVPKIKIELDTTTINPIVEGKFKKHDNLKDVTANLEVCVKCSDCKVNYEKVMTNTNQLMVIKHYNCSQCAFEKTKKSLKYNRNKQCVRPYVTHLLKTLKYEFGDKVVVSYNCDECSTLVERDIPRHWNIWNHTLCIKCYRNR